MANNEDTNAPDYHEPIGGPLQNLNLSFEHFNDPDYQRMVAFYGGDMGIATAKIDQALSTTKVGLLISLPAATVGVLLVIALTAVDESFPQLLSVEVCGATFAMITALVVATVSSKSYATGLHCLFLAGAVLLGWNAYRAHGVARHVFLELGASLVIGVVLDGSAVGSWSSPGEGSPRQTIPTPN